jgi:hypothetical protein
VFLLTLQHSATVKAFVCDMNGNCVAYLFHGKLTPVRTKFAGRDATIMATRCPPAATSSRCRERYLARPQGNPSQIAPRLFPCPGC